MTPPHGESLAERFEALAALREEGLIRHLGLSNVDADHLAEARRIAPIAAVQNSFHIAKRDEAALLDACAEGGIAFVPFGPIGGGHTDLNNERLAKVAARHGATVSQIALAWLLRISPVTLAIPGTGSVAHLEENMAARSIALAGEDVADARLTGRPKRAEGRTTRAPFFYLSPVLPAALVAAPSAPPAPSVAPSAGLSAAPSVPASTTGVPAS